ncbi:MAG: hypothetical protein ACTS4Z_01325 [Candidatus Hodgkinia cicadicola]
MNSWLHKRKFVRKCNHGELVETTADKDEVINKTAEAENTLKRGTEMIDRFHQVPEAKRRNLVLT